LITHEVTERQINQALNAIREQGCTESVACLLRVL
jgi:hypothetical protein